MYIIDIDKVVSLSERSYIHCLEFSAADLSEPQRPKYKRLYEEYVTATIHVFHDGAELEYTDKLPSRIELSDTVLALSEGVESLLSTGTADGPCFCCACGVRTCAYITWKLELDGDQVHMDIETLAGNPIGDHQYTLPVQTLLSAIIDLCETLLAFLSDRGIDTLSTGSRTAFERRRDMLERRLEDVIAV